MLGAESQNMFDLYDGLGDDADDDDSVDDPNDGAAGLVIPRGALQMGGESAGECIEGTANSVRHLIRVQAPHPAEGNNMPAGSGEASGSRSDPVAMQQRYCESQTRSTAQGAPLDRAAEEIQSLPNPHLPSQSENKVNNGAASIMDEATERLLRTWASAHNVDVSEVPGIEQLGSTEDPNERERKPSADSETGASDAQGEDSKPLADAARIRGGSPDSAISSKDANPTTILPVSMKVQFTRKPGLAKDSLPYEAIARLDGHGGPVSSVIFSSDGKYCLTGSYDRTVRLWNPLRLDPAHPPPKTFVREHDGGIQTQNLPHSLPIQVYRDGITHPVGAIAIDEQSTTILSASEKTLVVNDVVTGQCKRRLQGHVGRINAVSLNRDAQVYLSASYDATVRLWDGRSRSFDPIQVLKDAKDSVTAVHCLQTDDLTVIRTASVDGVVRCYDLRMGMLQDNIVGDPITGMSSTSDPQCLLVNCLDGALRLLDLNKGKVVQQYANGHTAGQYSLDCTVSAGDEYAVTGSENGAAVFYDVSHGRVCQVLEGHQQPTCSVAVHPQLNLSSVAITASYDGTSVVWGNDGSLMQW